MSVTELVKSGHVYYGRGDPSANNMDLYGIYKNPPKQKTKKKRKTREKRDLKF